MVASNAKRPDAINTASGRDFLKSFVKQEASRLRLAIAAGTISTILLLIQWLLFSHIAHNILVEGLAISSQNLNIVYLLVCVILRPIFNRAQSLSAQKASQNIRNNIRQGLQQFWRNTSPLTLKNTSNGVFATQYVDEVEAMDAYFSRYWPQQALAIISPLIILSVVAYLNWLCALLLLISAPLIPLFMILVGMGAEALNQRYSLARQRLAGHFLDRVANLPTIKLLGAEQSVHDEVAQNSNLYRKLVMKTLKLAFLSSTVLEFFTSVAIAALAIYIGFSLYGAITWGPANSLTLFSGLAILILAPEFFMPMRMLSQFYHDRASALGAANNLVITLGQEDVLKQTKPKQNKAYRSSEPSNNQLALTNLVLGFTPEAPLCEPISLSARSGTLLVVSGPSGAGKSTLLNTIAGFLPPLSGNINIPSKTGASIAFLPQQAWIKNASIYENLSALAPKASESQMYAVLSQLGLAKELDLQRLSVNTLIGEHGKGLSGGQMQRIAIARVMLNPAPIILLDEPTAKLDDTSKQYIINAIGLLRNKALVIIASHDPLLISMADKNIVISPPSGETL